MSELLRSPDAELAALEARIARLERLEEQVYFQERTLSALNEAITLQQRQLDDLQGRVEAVVLQDPDHHLLHALDVVQDYA